jgi:hypothetical protein
MTGYGHGGEHSSPGSRQRLGRFAADHSDAVLAAGAFLAWVLAAWVPVPLIRLVGALPLIFWLPGVALLRLARPERSPMSAASTCLSTALSTAVAIGVAIMLALTTKQVPRVPTATSLAGISITASLITSRRASVRSGTTAPAGETRLPWPTRWIAVTVAACTILTGLLGYLTWRLYETPTPNGSYTALSIDRSDGRTEVAVDSNEPDSMGFRLTITRARRTIAVRAFTLTPGAEYQMEVPASSAKAARDRTTIRLYTEPDGKLARSLAF